MEIINNDNKHEWRLSPFWTNVFIMMLLTIGAIVVPWYTGWLWLWLIGGIVLTFWWYKVLFVTDGDYTKFDETGITLYSSSDEEEESVAWNNIESLCFDWFAIPFLTIWIFNIPLIAIRIIFRQKDKSECAIPISPLLWPSFLLGINKLNRIANIPIVNKRKLFLSFLKALGKIVGLLVIVLMAIFCVVNVAMHFHGHWLEKIISIIFVVCVIFVVYIFHKKNIHIPDYFE